MSRFLSHPAPSEAPECLKRHLSKHSNNGGFERPRHPFHHLSPCTFSPPQNPMSNPPQAASDSILIPTASASAICDGLLRMAHCLILELPEAELRGVRYTLSVLSMRADQLLDSAVRDFALNFDGLAIDPGKSSRPYPNLSSPARLVQTLATTLGLKILVRLWSRRPSPPQIAANRSPLLRLPVVVIPPVESRFLLRPRSQLGLQP